MLKEGDRSTRDLEEYRALMGVPSEFEDGFNLRSVLGAFFIGFVMLPGSIYLGLIAGRGMGPAAEWVTIILFAEIARRSFTVLRKQEVFVLFYIAGGLTEVVLGGGLMLAGGPFAEAMWHQYLVQSTAAEGFGIAGQIPEWVSPPADSPALVHRTLFHKAWIPAVTLIAFKYIATRMAWFGAGYTLFRIHLRRRESAVPDGTGRRARSAGAGGVDWREGDVALECLHRRDDDRCPLRHRLHRRARPHRAHHEGAAQPHPHPLDRHDTTHRILPPGPAPPVS